MLDECAQESIAEKDKLSKFHEAEMKSYKEKINDEYTVKIQDEVEKYDIHK